MTEQEIKQRLAALCSQAEHCSGEMRDKMDRWEVDEDTQQRVIDFLQREKYIDDARFTRCFALDKIRFAGWGRRKIEQALWAKHVDRTVSQPVLDDIDDDEYIRVLQPLMQSKRRTVKANSDYERNMKLFRWAMSRGFLYEQIKACIDGDIDQFDQ